MQAGERVIPELVVLTILPLRQTNITRGLNCNDSYSMPTVFTKFRSRYSLVPDHLH